MTEEGSPTRTRKIFDSVECGIPTGETNSPTEGMEDLRNWPTGQFWLAAELFWVNGAGNDAGTSQHPDGKE